MLGDAEIHLHSTMYLLNQACVLSNNPCQRFTFHYVSIKSFSSLHAGLSRLFHLHSTMYLLNQAPQQNSSMPDDIYIPLCIY